VKVVFWGSYDIGKPRTRILLRGLRAAGVEVIECHHDLWHRVEDKSRITARLQQVGYLARLLLAYPGLIRRYFGLPAHDAVVVGYPGQLDALLLRPFVWLRGVPLVLDLVQSAYLTLVHVRGTLTPRQPAARALLALERLALRRTDRVVFLSRFGATDLAPLFKLSPERTGAVMIGVEPEHFPPAAPRRLPDPTKRPLEVLFYGSFHRLHGIDSIIEAARLARDLPIHWTLIGQGQEEVRIRALLARVPLPKLNWVPWVPYQQLFHWLHRSDIALGLLGRPAETGWAIPNKVCQIISAGVPLITADTPAVRELVGGDRPDLALVPPGDAVALLAALRRMAERLRAPPVGDRRHADLFARLHPEAIGQAFLDQIEQTLEARRAAGAAPC
jgi:glycosyltransferase involved in cell wall biosynthesis